MLVIRIIVNILFMQTLVHNVWKKAHLKAYRVFLKFVGSSNDKTSRNLFRLFQLASYATAIVFVTNIFSLCFASTNFGSFGDYFGGMLNPILTFLTFMGLLITIVLQQKELRLTRNEIKSSSKALQEQAETQEKQRFENTFFSLFEQHNLLLNAICEPNEQSTHKRSGLSEVHRLCTNSNLTSLKEAKGILQNNNQLVGHYFRTLYQLLKLIATKHPGSKIGLGCPEKLLQSIPVTSEEKFYSNLVRSVLSYEVTQVLAINCYSEDDSFSKFKQLVIRYQFFEHMPLEIKNNKCAVLQSAYEHFGPEAFGKSQFVN